MNPPVRLPPVEAGYLSRADFRTAQACPTRLYYRKQGYPTQPDRDEQLAALAAQLPWLQALARALFADGYPVDPAEDVEGAAWNTMAALADDPCTLFDATFVSGGKLAQVDILTRRGNQYELFCVVPHWLDHEDSAPTAGLAGQVQRLLRGGRDDRRASWRPVLEDVAFQVLALQEAVPGARVTPYLLVPDPERVNHAAGLFREFEPRCGDLSSAEMALPVIFTGDARLARRSLLLARLDVAREVDRLLEEVRQAVDEHAGTLLPVLRRVTAPLGDHCASCEFRAGDGARDGYRECHQAPAAAKNGAARRLPDRPYYSDRLAAALDGLAYPLRFLDVGHCAPAVPPYEGLRPLEHLAFHWACQTVERPGGAADHGDWLQAADSRPDAAFAAALREELGDDGSVVVWGAEPARVLRAVGERLGQQEPAQQDTARWLAELVESGRLVDLQAIARKHYYHPSASDNASLAEVAGAAARGSARQRARLAEYLLQPADASVDLYRAVAPLWVGERPVPGSSTAARVLAYYALLDALAAGRADDARRHGELLRQAGRVNSLALLSVWWHWRDLVA